jgi:hypothetical protein
MPWRWGGGMILSNLEKQVLRAIRKLPPGGHASDLEIEASEEEIAGAIDSLRARNLVSGTIFRTEKTHMNYYIGLDLTPAGHDVLREGDRHWFVRFVLSDWKWSITTLIAVAALIVALFK